MWDDFHYQDNEKARKAYEAWTDKVRKLILNNSNSTVQDINEKSSPVGNEETWPDIVIVEVGCGIRIPSARLHAENWVRTLNHPKPPLGGGRGGGTQQQAVITSEGQQGNKRYRCILVRINPDYTSKRTTLVEPGHILWYDPDAVISIKAGGKETILKIHEALFAKTKQ